MVARVKFIPQCIAHSPDARRVFSRRLLALVMLGLLSGCANTPPSNTESICAIFQEKSRWYRDAKKSESRWGTPVHVMMAIIRQESTFQFNARPPRKKLLGVIPWKRPSDAYGYAQVLDSTWDWYKSSTGNRGADRDDFDDAIDFVGWYTDLSQKTHDISKWDPYNQYLAYHEGHTGWKRGHWKNKDWLIQAAKRVQRTAEQWGTQLRTCESGFSKRWWQRS